MTVRGKTIDNGKDVDEVLSEEKQAEGWSDLGKLGHGRWMVAWVVAQW